MTRVENILGLNQTFVDFEFFVNIKFRVEIWLAQSRDLYLKNVI